MDPRKRSKPKDIPVIKTNHISKIAEEEKPIKAGSSFDIPLAIGHRDELFVDDLPRRRSNSAPLTLEATGLANKLRLASDSFQSAYEKGSKMKKRRATVHRMDVKRRSWPAWNPQIEEEQEEDAVFHYSSSLPSNEIREKMQKEKSLKFSRSCSYSNDEASSFSQQNEV